MRTLARLARRLSCRHSMLHDGPQNASRELHAMPHLSKHLGDSMQTLPASSSSRVSDAGKADVQPQTEACNHYGCMSAEEHNSECCNLWVFMGLHPFVLVQVHIVADSLASVSPVTYRLLRMDTVR